MASYNIEMNMLNEDNEYDILYPKTETKIVYEEGTYIGNGESSFYISLTKEYIYVFYFGVEAESNRNLPQSIPSYTKTTAYTDKDVYYPVFENSLTMLLCPNGSNHSLSQIYYNYGNLGNSGSTFNPNGLQVAVPSYSRPGYIALRDTGIFNKNGTTYKYTLIGIV